MRTFSKDSFVELGEKITKVKGASHGDYTLCDYEGGEEELLTEILSPLTLRNGDYCKTEGMTQAQFDLIRGNDKGPRKAGKCPYLAFRLEWLPSNRDDDDFERELTPEQILSTLPVEEEAQYGDDFLQTNYGKLSQAELLKKAPEIGDKPKTPEGGPDFIQHNWSEAPVDWEKPIQTEDGTKAVVLSHGEKWLMIAIEHAPDRWVNARFGYDNQCGFINVPEEHKLEGWLTIQKDCSYWSRDKPDIHDIDVSIAIIDLSELNITYVNGEGLGDE